MTEAEWQSSCIPTRMLVSLWLLGLVICAFVGYYPPHAWGAYREKVGDWFVPAGLLVGFLIGGVGVLVARYSWWKRLTLCVATAAHYLFTNWFVCFWTELRYAFGYPG